jgi:hypothetical protein
MSNAFKTTQKVANRLLMILKNQLVVAKLADSRFSSDFGGGDGNVPIGDTITVRRPPLFTATSGASFVPQDIVVGSTQLQITNQRHVGMTLTDFERILSYDGDSFLKDAVANAKMSALSQQVDQDVAATILQFPGFVGTVGNKFTTIAGFNAMPNRLDNKAVPTTDRVAVLSPDDYWGLVGAFTGTIPYDNSINQTALQKAKLPMIGQVDTYMTQNVPTFTAGTRTNGTVSGNGQAVTYATAKDTYTQTLNLAGLGAGGTVAVGDTFTIANRYAVNPRSQAKLSYLQQFTVTAAATADGTGAATVTITPPIITSGAYQTVDSAPANGDVVTWVGSAGATIVNNACYHKSALALAWVRPAKPETGTYSYAEDPDTGISLRLWGFSDGTADTHSYRADVIYGVKNIDTRLGTRGNGA